MSDDNCDTFVCLGIDFEMTLILLPFLFRRELLYFAPGGAYGGASCYISVNL